MDEIEREAKRRTESHRGHASQRILGKDHDLVGLRGEEAFGKKFGQKPDLTARPRGDGGIDFWLLGYKVNTKCCRKWHLGMLVKEEECKPKTIYVHCAYNEETDDATLIGWQWGSVVRKYPPKDTGWGIVNHNVPVLEGLRGISELEAHV